MNIHSQLNLLIVLSMFELKINTLFHETTKNTDAIRVGLKALVRDESDRIGFGWRMKRELGFYPLSRVRAAPPPKFSSLVASAYESAHGGSVDWCFLIRKFLVPFPAGHHHGGDPSSSFLANKSNLCRFAMGQAGGHAWSQNISNRISLGLVFLRSNQSKGRTAIIGQKGVRKMLVRVNVSFQGEVRETGTHSKIWDNWF